MTIDLIRIGIVDDHKLFRQGIVQILKRFPGFEVIIEVENCRQLIEAMDVQMPDVILVDLEMPDMDGMEGSKLLLERFPTVKIIVLSMHSAAHFIFHMMKIGARSYLPKDVDQEELRKAIEKVVYKGYYFTDSINKAMLRGIKTSTRQKPQFNNTENPISKREMEVLVLICKGLTTSDIASQLFISARTVEGHRQNLLEKTDTSNSVSLAVFAFKKGLLEN